MATRCFAVSFCHLLLIIPAAGAESGKRNEPSAMERSRIKFQDAEYPELGTTSRTVQSG
jgi:hypothetical protein